MSKTSSRPAASTETISSLVRSQVSDRCFEPAPRPTSRLQSLQRSPRVVAVVNEEHSATKSVRFVRRPLADGAYASLSLKEPLIVFEFDPVPMAEVSTSLGLVGWSSLTRGPVRLVVVGDTKTLGADGLGAVLHEAHNVLPLPPLGRLLRLKAPSPMPLVVSPAESASRDLGCAASIEQAESNDLTLSPGLNSDTFRHSTLPSLLTTRNG